MLVLLFACAPPTVPADLDRPSVVADPGGGACVSVQLDRWDADHRARQVALLQSLGVRAIRQDLRWSYVQSSRDSWDWTTEDAVIDAAAAGGLRVIAMVGYGNPWASTVPGATSFAPPDDPADFAAFAGAAAARYADRIDRYEIWNEPNSGFRFWQVGDPPAFGGDPEGYADLFVPAAEAIHGADPGSEVQVGSVFFHGQAIPSGPEFLADAVAHRPDLLAAADAVSFHPYTLYPPRSAPEADADGEIAIVQMVADIEAAAPGLPVVVTEFGWPSWGEVTPELQAAYTAREVALLHASGVRDTCVYTLEDHDGPVGNPEDAFGLVEDVLGAEKPVAQAWRGLGEALSGVSSGHGSVEDVLGLADGARAVRYVRADGGAVTLLWTTGADSEVLLPNVDDRPKCAAIDGVDVGEVPPEGVTVPVTTRPVAVVQGVCL